MGGVVDASGAVSAILSQYRSLLLEYQRAVTGDPDALTAAAQREAQQANSVTGRSTELGQTVQQLGGSWQGRAHDAFAGAGRSIGSELTLIGTALSAQSAMLGGAATALRTAKSTVDSVLARFDQYAQQLIAQSRTSAAGAVNAFLSAARDLGESAVAGAKKAADQLGQTLGQLFGIKADEAKTDTGHIKADFIKKHGGPLSWVDGSGRVKPYTAPKDAWSRYTGFGGWKELSGDGVKNASAPPKDSTPLGKPKPTSTAGKLFDQTEITYFQAKSDKDFALWTLAKGGTGKQLGTFGPVDTSYEGKYFAGLHPEGEFSVSSEGKELKLSGKASMSVLDASLEGKGSYGMAEGSAKASAFLGGQAAASFKGGIGDVVGAGGHVNLFAGGKLEGELAGDVGGIGGGVSGSVQYGIGGQLDLQAMYDRNTGHILFNAKAGAALGLGFGGGAKIDIDVPKVIDTVGQYGSGAVTAVEHAASGAADAIGSAWNNTVSYVDSW